MTDDALPGFHPDPSTPRLRLPPGACDAHVHVYGPQSQFPFAADRTFTPGDAPKETLFALHARLGITRCVVVQSGAHGFDNQVVADALAAKAGAYRGIALVRPEIADAGLRALDEQGFCGVRFNYMGHLGRQVPMSEVLALAGRLADLSWHLQIHLDPAGLPELAPALLQSPVPVVIDHMARIPADPGQRHPSFAHLCRLLDTGRCWVKVSGADRATLQGPPYADAVPMAQRLVADYPDQVLWGTDWPHPNHAGPVPDDGELVNLLAEIAPTLAARQALLVDNPHRLYRFRD
ncbi:MAG: amidohydrolase family protein [Janthinobacterium lividum]